MTSTNQKFQVVEPTQLSLPPHAPPLRPPLPSQTPAAHQPAAVGVPMADLRAQYNALRSEIHQTLHDVLGSTQYILGPHVERFEQAFAQFTGARHCVGVNSGTSALHLALIAAGV